MRRLAFLTRLMASGLVLVATTYPFGSTGAGTLGEP